MSEKKRKKLEHFVSSWEKDVGKTEQDVSKFKDEFNCLLNQIQKEIHEMQKYGKDNTVGGQLEDTRKLYRQALQKLSSFEI